MLEHGDRGAPNRRTQYATSDQGSPIDAGSGYRAVVVNTDSSKDLRDLVSLRRDIELAKTFGDSLLRLEINATNSSREPALALWIAALTSYGRAFKSGVRGDRPSITMFDENEAEWHRYLVELRDKHVAHAVNDYEQTIVIAYLTDSAFAKRDVTRVGHIHADLFSSEEEVIALIALCDRLIVDLNRRIRKMRKVISEEVLALGIEALYVLPDAVVPTHDPAKVAQRRK